MKLLALDLSTKSGYALFEDGVLTGFGVLTAKKKVAEFGKYPFNYVIAADWMANKINDELISKINPDVVVIEQTNSARNRFSQKILEFIHKSVLSLLQNTNIKVYYISSSIWRRTLGLGATKEDKKNNSLINKAAKQGKSKKELGLKGKITPKHRAIRFVNETYNKDFKMKDNDLVDAICLGEAFLRGATICNGK